MAKVDIRNTYRVVPVHPEDRWLMGMTWKGEIYIDTVLSFGLRSAPKIFTALADALEWIARSNGVRFIIHYLDDFLLVGAPGSNQCAPGSNQCTLVLRILDQLGVPVARDMLEGPTPKLTFLGFEVDSLSWEIRLPVEKLRELQHLVKRWSDRCSCTSRELESLVGRLAHASRTIKPGKPLCHECLDSWPASGEHTIMSVSMCHFDQIFYGGQFLWNHGTGSHCYQRKNHKWRCGLMLQGRMDAGQSHRTYVNGYNYSGRLTTGQGLTRGARAYCGKKWSLFCWRAWSG